MHCDKSCLCELLVSFSLVIWGSLDATLEDSDKNDAKTFSFVKKLAANVESRKKGLGQCLCMFLLL